MDDLDIIVNAKDETIQRLMLDLQKAEANALTAVERQTAYELKLISKEQQLNELQDFARDLLKRKTYNAKAFLDPFLINQYTIIQNVIKDSKDTLVSSNSSSKPDKSDTRKEAKLVKLEEELKALRQKLARQGEQYSVLRARYDQSQSTVCSLQDERDRLAMEVMFLSSKSSSSSSAHGEHEQEHEGSHKPLPTGVGPTAGSAR